MSYSVWISAIRALANGNKLTEPPNRLAKFLLRQECFYLLSEMGNTYEVDLAKNTMLINKMVVRDRLAACSELFSSLSQENIPYAVIKGAVLSKSAYNNSAIRCSNDIDLLVSPKKFEDIHKKLLQNGFIQGKIENKEVVPLSRREQISYLALTHQAAPYLKRIESRYRPIVNIDINLDIFWGERTKSMAGKSDMDSFLRNVNHSEIESIGFFKLTPIYEFISLCLHHYKDMNSIYLIANNGIKLSALCDIYFFLKNNYIDPDLLKNVGDLYTATPYVYYCIHITNQLFNDSLLFPFVEALHTSEGEGLLECYGLDETERRQWKYSFEQRLFDSEFRASFFNNLTDSERQKIEKNQLFM